MNARPCRKIRYRRIIRTRSGRRKYEHETTWLSKLPWRRRTSNVRLPLELSSDWRETLATRVSEALQLSMFRGRNFFGQNFRIEKAVFRQFGEVLEDLRPNGRQNQLPRQNLLQIDLFWGLYDPKSRKTAFFKAGVKVFDSIGSIFLSIRSILRPRIVVDRPC